MCCHLAPQGIDGDAGEVDGPLGAGGVQCGANQYRHICLGQGRYPCLRQHRLDVGDAVCRYLAPHHVVKRQHTVGLAATKGGFQLDDRLAVPSADPLECLHQQTGHALGDVGAGKKFHRVTVFKGSLTPRYLSQIGGKLCVFVASLRHIRVGFHHVPPAGQTGQGLAHNTGVGSLRLRRGGNLHHVGGAFGAAVAELAQDLADLLGGFIVKGFAQARHGIQRTPCVIL